MRAMIVVRLSRVSESSTSVARQIEICEDFCRVRGWSVSGVLSDTDVSGAVDPFDFKARPELAGWLAEPTDADVLVVYRADRLTRSVRHLQRLVHWAEDNNRLIVSATEPHFDMTSPFSAVILALIGTISEWELQAITERNRSTHQRNRRLGKYTGGTPPWPYMADKGSDGWVIVPDPGQVPVFNRIVKQVLDGVPLMRVCNELSDEGVLTPKDAARKAAGKPVKGTRWSSVVVKRALTSQALLGYVISGGKVLRDESGAPIVRSEPVVDRVTFDRIGEAIGARAVVRKAAHTPSLLTQVLFCSCGQPAYRFNGGSHSQYPRYRCDSISKGTSCGNSTVAVSFVDEQVEKLVIGLLGGSNRMVRQYIPGNDFSAELADIDAELIDVTGLIGSPAYKAGTPQRAALDARIEGLVARQEYLQSQPVTQAGYRWVESDELFGDWWDSTPIVDRNLWLRDMGVRVEFTGKHLDVVLGDIPAMAGQVSGGVVGEWDLILSELQTAGLSGVTVSGDEIAIHQ